MNTSHDLGMQWLKKKKEKMMMKALEENNE